MNCRLFPLWIDGNSLAESKRLANWLLGIKWCKAGKGQVIPAEPPHLHSSIACRPILDKLTYLPRKTAGLSPSVEER